MRVLFRKEKDGSVTAILPDLRANIHRLVCYAHVGQHSECTFAWYRKDTSLAKKEEYEPLLNELQSIYKDKKLRVVSNIRENNWVEGPAHSWKNLFDQNIYK